MIWFWIGSASGFCAAVALFLLMASLFVARRANDRDEAQRAERERPYGDREKLALARRYLGQIMTRDSIKHVRMIGKKALEETGEEKNGRLK